MRYLVCLLLGALFGALLAMTASSALQRRNAWPRAMMIVMQHELAGARDAVRQNRCSDPALPTSRAHLALLADDLERALLPKDGKDRVLSQYASDMRAAVAAWQPDAACAAQAEAVSKVSQACDACHRDYR